MSRETLLKSFASVELLVISTFLFAGIVSIYVTYSKEDARRPPGPPKRLDLRFGKWFTLLKQRITPGDTETSKDNDKPTWMKFTELNKLYGPVISLYQGNTMVVVLGTIKAANDLLEKRGNIYSSRPRNIMAGEILSGNMRGLGMPYGTRWRNWRSLMHARMGIEASNDYKVLQRIESAIMLHGVINPDPATSDDPNRTPASHLRRFATSIACCVGYGRRVKTMEDPIVEANIKTDEYYGRLTAPGRYIVESWPILLKLPKFLQWFRYEPEARRKIETKLFLSLMNDVRKQMDSGEAHPSTARKALEKQAESGLTDLETAYALSSPFTAGVGTTMATLEFFILAMLHYPAAMKRAQSEIDLVVGGDRLPDFDDSESLPYVRAMIKEIMRWRPITPSGIPHSVIADDVYEDMFIPAGATVISNIHAMSIDEQYFPSPEEFKPERYLERQSDSHAKIGADNFFFGFGRRVCPGMHIAQNSVFIVVTRILWAFDVLPLLDDNGQEIIPPKDKFEGGIVCHPKRFGYRLVIREERKGNGVQIINEHWSRAELEASEWN